MLKVLICDDNHDAVNGIKDMLGEMFPGHFEYAFAYGEEDFREDADFSCDVLIMDPPRAGASPAFIRSAGKLKPDRIVYVSCRIETLERDLLLLKKEGFRVTKIQPFDMFPHTTGIETVCLLER